MVVNFYNYANTIPTCTDTLSTANDTPRIPVHAVDCRDESFCIEERRLQYSHVHADLADVLEAGKLKMDFS